MNPNPLPNGIKTIKIECYDSGKIDINAGLELNTKERGFVLPRVTTAQRDAFINPENSTLIFNEDDYEFEYYSIDEGGWQVLNPLRGLDQTLEIGNLGLRNMYLRNSPNSDGMVEVNVDDDAEAFIKVLNSGAGASGRFVAIHNNSIEFNRSTDGVGNLYPNLINPGSWDWMLPANSGTLAVAGRINDGQIIFANEDGIINLQVDAELASKLREKYIDAYNGMKLEPINPTCNGYYINRSANEAVGFKATNANTTGNGSLAEMVVKGEGTEYVNYGAVSYFGNSYYIAHLRNSAGLYSDKDLYVFTSGANRFIDFRTGGAYNATTSKFRINADGKLNIGVAPAYDGAATRAISRNASGDVVEVDLPTASKLLGTTLNPSIVNSSLLTAAGGTFGTAAFTPATNYEVPLTFTGPLIRTGNTISLNDVSRPRTLAASGRDNISTATLSTQIVYSKLLPAGSFIDDSVLRLSATGIRVSGNNANYSIRVYLNETNDLTTPYQLALLTILTANNWGKMSREFAVKDNTIVGYNNTNSLNTDEFNNNSLATTTTLDFNTPYYFIVAVTLQNVADVVNVKIIDFESSK